MNIYRMRERAYEIEKMLSAVLDDYTIGVDFFKILEIHDNLIYASTNDSCYEFTLEELMLEYLMLLDQPKKQTPQQMGVSFTQRAVK